MIQIKTAIDSEIMVLTQCDIFPRKFREKKNKPQLFDGLGEDAFEFLLQNSVLQDYESGRLLVQQGDIPTHVYFIVEGALKTLRTDEEGHETTIRMLEAGDTCMDAVIFMGGPSPIAVQVVKDSRLLLIPDTIIKSLVLKDTQFANNLLRIVTRHYKNALHQIDAMNAKTPLQRVGYYFLSRHLENGHDRLEFELPFKKSMIANYLGMTPETFSRTLKQMKSMGIDVEDDKIQMRDAYTLCHFCDSDTAAICSRHNKDDCPQCPIHRH